MSSVRLFITMFSCGFFPQRRVLLAVILLCSVCTDALAAFGGLMPLNWSGQLSYNYGYADNGGSEVETTNLLLGVNANGYIWHPWFASTSLALNVGLSNTVTTRSSADSTVGGGTFSLSLFPDSRFPFSVSYSRSDSRSQSFQDVSQTSGDLSFTVTRLSVRQSYRPRGYGQLFNAWYYSNEFDGAAFTSGGEVYGLDYRLRFSRHSLSWGATHSESTNSSNSNDPSTDVSSLTHVYTPSNELGVNSLVSFVQVDPGDGGPVSKDTQAFSSFFWRPEHRSVNVSGGVKLSESKVEGAVSSVARSLVTNLSLGYRLTRSLNLSADATVGAADSNDTQTLSTAQKARISYSGSQRQILGLSHGWQWGAGAGNSNTRTEQFGITRSSDQQSYSTGLGQNISKSWSLSRSSTLSGSFSQSGSASKNSESDIVGKALNHGLSLSWNRRGGRGSTYASARMSDSRSYGEKDSVFRDFGVNLVGDVAFDRLSSLSGNMNFSASQNESENTAGGEDTSGSRLLSGGLAYQNARPFGLYNLQFSSDLIASKQVDSDMPTATWRWESVFRYSLGLLSTSLRFQVAEASNGNVSKSMNFQATRSF